MSSRIAAESIMVMQSIVRHASVMQMCNAHVSSLNLISLRSAVFCGLSRNAMT